jgi:hypothetical protein
MSQRMGGNANDELVWTLFNALADSGLAAGGDPAACVAIVGALIHTRESLFFAKAAYDIKDDATFTRPEALVSHNRFLNSDDIAGLASVEGQPSEVA